MRIREKTLWKSRTFVPEIDRSETIHNEPITKIEIVCRQYVCPICKQTKQYFTVNGSVVKGMKGHYYDQDYCGSEKCGRVIERWNA